MATAGNQVLFTDATDATIDELADPPPARHRQRTEGRAIDRMNWAELERCPANSVVPRSERIRSLFAAPPAPLTPMQWCRCRRAFSACVRPAEAVDLRPGTPCTGPHRSGLGLRPPAASLGPSPLGPSDHCLLRAFSDEAPAGSSVSCTKITQPPGSPTAYRLLSGALCRKLRTLKGRLRFDQQHKRTPIDAEDDPMVRRQAQHHTIGTGRPGWARVLCSLHAWPKCGVGAADSPVGHRVLVLDDDLNALLGQPGILASAGGVRH